MSDEDIEASKAPLIDHLIELRSRLIKALIGFGIAFIFCFFFAKQIYNVLVWPFVWVAGAENSKFIYTALLEYFITQLKLALFGAGFLFLEIREFVGMIAIGAGPQRSAFLSAFFTLVGCHGVHVTLGLMWLLTMMAQVFAKGYRSDILRRVLCFSLFWHTLDIIWVAIFTVVYLMGAAR